MSCSLPLFWRAFVVRRQPAGNPPSAAVVHRKAAAQVALPSSPFRRVLTDMYPLRDSHRCRRGSQDRRSRLSTTNHREMRGGIIEAFGERPAPKDSLEVGFGRVRLRIAEPQPGGAGAADPAARIEP